MAQSIRIQIPPEKLAEALAKYFTKPLLEALERDSLRARIEQSAQ